MPQVRARISSIVAQIFNQLVSAPFNSSGLATPSLSHAPGAHVQFFMADLVNRLQEAAETVAAMDAPTEEAKRDLTNLRKTTLGFVYEIFYNYGSACRWERGMETGGGWGAAWRV